MAFQNIAGRAGFLLELDKSQLTHGLPDAEREFDSATAAMARSADRAGESVGDATAGVGLAGRLGSMGSLLGRAGLYGIGISTAISLNRELSSALDTTGAKAFTTEGKIRNMASAFLSGDIVGGLLSLRAAPKTLDDLGISAQQAAGRIDALKKVAFGQAEALREQADGIGDNKKALEEYDAIVKEAGTSNQQLAAQLLEQGRAWQELSTQMRGAFNAALAFRGPQGEVIFQGGFAGLRPQPPAGPGPTTFGTPVQTPTPIGPGSRLQGRITVAQANGDLEEVLRLQTIQRDRLQKAFENSHGNVQQREKLNQQLAAATAAVIQTQKQIAAQDKAEQDAANAAAESAANERARQLRASLATREQQLRNQYEAALQTPGMRDDRRRFAALRNFLLGESRDTRLTAGERADFRGELIALQGQRKKDIQDAVDAANQETRDELAAQEQVLKNRVKAAELTKKNKADDLKALRALRDFYRMEERDRKDVFSDIEQARFGSDRLDTQKKIADLLAGKDTATTAPDLGGVLRDFMKFQHEFLTGLVSQFLGGTGAGNALQTHALEQFTLQGNAERAAQTGLLKEIARHRGSGRGLDEALMS